MKIGTAGSSNGFMRTVASIVLVTFTTVTVSPSVQAMQQFAGQQAAQEHLALQERESVGKSLIRARDRLRVLANKTRSANGQATAAQRSGAREELRAWRNDYRALKTSMRAELDATGALLSSKNLPQEIRDRQAQAVAVFEAESAALESDIDKALDATDDGTAAAGAQAAFERLEKKNLHRSQQTQDPGNLPNRTLQANPDRKPMLQVEAFQAALLLAEPTARLAQTAGFDFSKLPGASNATYLEATTEVVLSEDIRAKAAQLAHDPIAIYNWVRNNVRWQPTWGAIQDASHTLSAQRGNAFDIAALTLALLRASGIPSRYVHGTIELPEAQFRNWAGGFDNVAGAIDFASAGGIPIVSVTSGGRVTKVRLEHIWVEAAIDSLPSRGAKNRVADTWVPLDPSYKQLEILTGVNAVQIAGIDPAQVAQSTLAGATINANEGWVSGLNATAMQNAQAQARTTLEAHVQENLLDSTVSQVLGGKRIISETRATLPTSLPNRILVAGARYASIPSSLQQRMTFAFARDIEGEPVDAQTFAAAQLNGRRLTLSFKPAAQADQDALAALLPTGEITDYRQIPTTIPAYLIRVVPELKLDGTVLMSGNAVTLGQEIDFVFTPTFVSSGARPFSYKLPAGSYLAVAALSGAMAPARLAAARGELTTLQAAVATPGNPAAAALTRDDILGDPYVAGLFSYYGEYEANAEMLSRNSNGHYTLGAGLGTFGYEPEVDYFFGVPRSLKPGAAAFNVPIVHIVGSKTDEPANRRMLTVQVGLMSSALEHVVPEQIDPTTQAISAARAFEIAAIQGRRVVGADQDNVEAALAQASLDFGAANEVRAAVAAGRQAIMHTGVVSVPGWSGSGYILLDPITGAGAYKISGGSNGGIQQAADGMTIMAAGASGYLEGRTGNYVGKDFWFSERLKYMARVGNGVQALGYVGFAISVMQIMTDDTLSTTDKLLRVCTEMLFFGITNYITGALAAAMVAPIGTVALPLVLSVALAAAVAVAMAYALLTIKLMYFAGLRRAYGSRWA